MTTLALLTRIYNANQLKQIDRILQAPFEDLDVEVRITGVVAERWVELSLSGEDEGIAANYLRKEFGLCPKSLMNIKKFSTLKGYITEIENKDVLTVDIGVFEPRIINATILLSNLQARLVDGRKAALKKIAELYGLDNNVPLTIKILNVNKDEDFIEAELSLDQVERFKTWQDSLLDRLLVLGASSYQVNTTLERSGLDRDIIAVEPLGVFEHSLVCKLGTDAAGLIGRIGRNLWNSKLTVFNPKQLREFLTT